MQKLLSEIGKAIKELRKSRALSQSQLAEMVGTKQANISDIEAGSQNITLETLFSISEALKFDIDLKFKGREGKKK